MTTDSPTPPAANPPPDDSGNPPAAPRRGRALRAVAWAAGGAALAMALVVLALVGALTTESGTRLAWQAAEKATGGRLSGTVVDGSLADGVRLTGVRWHSLDGKGDDIRIDRISGRWALTHSPWRLSIDYLHAGTIDAHFAPSTSTGPTPLPHDLRLPLQLEVRDLRVDKLLLRDGDSTTEFGRFVFHGRSDGRHHEASIDRLDTPFGAVTAKASLDGMRPFKLTGNAGYAGKLNEEPVELRASVSGTLEALIAEVDASGMKLAGRAHVEVAPFSDVPLTRATLAFDHVNPQAFSPDAPLADLALRAELAPAPHVEAAPAGSAHAHEGEFVVTGPVSVVNAKPGALGEHLLPLVEARADVRLGAGSQRISNLSARLVKNATLTGGGALTGERGQFDLHAAGLDLSTIVADVRQTALSGPIGIVLDGAKQSVSFDLADPQAALRAQAHVTFDPAQIAFSDVRVSSGQGRIELAGALKHDANSSYSVKATLTDFDPLALTAPVRTAQAKAGGGKNGKTAAGGKGAAIAANRKIEARVSGKLNATGALAPTLAAKVQFQLGDSVYDGLPLTGAGTVQFAGTRILPSSANLSIAGNEVELRGSFGAAGDRLQFRVDAPQLERLGFGLAGLVQADGDLTGSFAHPNVAMNYRAQGVVFGANRIGAAAGHAQIRDGARGALEFTTEAHEVHAGGVDLATLSAHLSGTRAKHALDAAAIGAVEGRPLDVTLAANGGLSDTREGMRWDGTVTRLANRGMPALNLEVPLALSAGPERVTLGATRLTLEGAVLDLKSFAYERGSIRSAGSATNLSVARLLAIREELTGVRSSLRTDLVFDGDWDFSLGQTASGYARLARRGGDASIDTGRGVAPLGIVDIAARADFSGGRRLAATVHAQASRIGTVDAELAVPLEVRDGLLTIGEEAPLTGKATATVPSLKTTGGLFGPSYLLDGQLALNLAIAGTAAKPSVSGSLTGDGLSATLVGQGIALKDGVIRVALSENLVDFQQVEFHGADGTLRATGQVRLDGAEPDLTARIVADKLGVFASPDRQLSLSGSATVANGGAAGGIDIDGKFRVDHALFDMPEDSAPQLSDDVVIVRADATVRGAPPPLAPGDKPVGRFAPRANIDIDLGQDFRFRGKGADLGLRGTITALSAPNLLLRAVGNVRVTEGSTYTSFGRKLSIENGFFTFNGPVGNPGINILAMRRNQEVEAGVQVTGTIQAPVVKLVSEPNLPDNEKLSWLLFGHGTDQGNNLGQQSSMTAALALLGSATGKRVAQTFGLDEVSVGKSEVGLTDPQVVMVSKAINERLVFGYEQGLQAASNAFKATINLTRFWSVSAYGGTFQGVDLSFTRRFDSFWGAR